MDSLAVTDHGNLHAAWSFYDEAKAQKIRPILGLRGLSGLRRRAARAKNRPTRRPTTAISCSWPGTRRATAT